MLTDTDGVLEWPKTSMFQTSKVTGRVNFKVLTLLPFKFNRLKSKMTNQERKFVTLLVQKLKILGKKNCFVVSTLTYNLCKLLIS